MNWMMDGLVVFDRDSKIMLAHRVRAVFFRA